jgi:mono/diheme cytochrome c family protein
VLDAIAKGRARGQGQMPSGLIQGQDAQNVAAYIAKVAGQSQ